MLIRDYWFLMNKFIGIDLPHDEVCKICPADLPAPFGAMLRFNSVKTIAGIVYKGIT